MKKSFMIVLFVAVTILCFAGGKGEGGGGGGRTSTNNSTSNSASQSNQNSSLACVLYTASKPVQQNSFDNKYGFKGENGKTQSCLTCATLNVYAATTTGGLSQTAMDRTVQTGLQNGSIRSDGSVGNFSLLSSTTATNLGRNTYFDYSYATSDRTVQTMSVNQFRDSSYTAGILNNVSSNNASNHFTAVVKNNTNLQIIDSLNPNRPSASGYVNVNVRPLIEVSFNKSPK